MDWLIVVAFVAGVIAGAGVMYLLAVVWAAEAAEQTDQRFR